MKAPSPNEPPLIMLRPVSRLSARKRILAPNWLNASESRISPVRLSQDLGAANCKPNRGSPRSCLLLGTLGNGIGVAVNWGKRVGTGCSGNSVPGSCVDIRGVIGFLVVCWMIGVLVATSDEQAATTIPRQNSNVMIQVFSIVMFMTSLPIGNTCLIWCSGPIPGKSIPGNRALPNHCPKSQVHQNPPPVDCYY